MASQKDLKKKESTVKGKWTKTQKEKHNERRRKRYQENKAHREKIQERNRKYKRAKTEERHGAVVRMWKGQEILVYRIGKACELAGCDTAFLYECENLGVIPEPIFEGAHRVYTQHQIDLLRELHEKVLAAGADFNKAVMVKKQMAPIIKAKWGVVK